MADFVPSVQKVLYSFNDIKNVRGGVFEYVKLFSFHYSSACFGGK